MLLETWAENPTQPEYTEVHGGLQPDGSRPGGQVLMHRPVPGSLVDQLYPREAGWNPGSQSAPQPEQYQPPRNIVAELWARYKSLQAKRKA
jgi:hypothetical protein